MVVLAQQDEVKGVIEIESGLGEGIAVADGQLLGDLAELVPGGGDVCVAQSSLAPHLLVVEDQAGHEAVVNVVELAVNEVSVDADEVLRQGLDIDVVGLAVGQQIVMVGVVDVEDRRAVLTLEGERQLGPIVVPDLVDDIDLHIGVDLLVGVGEGLELRVAVPQPPVQSDGLALVDQGVGVVGEVHSLNIQTLGRLGVLNCRVLGLAA